MSLKQEIFDKVVIHMLTQNARSTNKSGGSCSYRGHAGKMCAVGCLIDDSEYSEEMEDFTIRDPIMVAWGKEKFGNADFQEIKPLLRVLQLIHDKIKVDEWSGTLMQCANHFNLNRSVFNHFGDGIDDKLPRSILNFSGILDIHGIFS